MEEGKKNDSGKQPWFAMPLKVLKPLADVFAAGEKLYKTFNCLKPFKDPDRRFYDAAMRHMEACQIDPLAIDEETGCYHGAQVCFNMLMRIHHHQADSQEQPIPPAGSFDDGDGYHYLQEGEAILTGDEALINLEWKPIRDDFFHPQAITIMQKEWHLPMRRKIGQATVALQSGDMLKRGDEVKGNDGKFYPIPRMWHGKAYDPTLCGLCRRFR